jgi:hypothetical protein
MKMPALLLIALPCLASAAAAGDVRFHFRGDVTMASNPNGAYAGVQVGDAVELRCDVFTTNPPPNVIAPGQYVEYVVDTTTMSVTLGSVVVPFSSGAPVVGMVNAFPVSDGVQGLSASLGSKSLSYSLNHNANLWSSVDPTTNYGTHPVVVDGSFSYTFQISGGGTFIEIFPTSIVVEPVGVGTNFCFGDGSGTACPCGNASNASDESGCMNSLGQAGKLRALGLASIANDTLTLNGSQMPNSSALYFQGTTRQNGGMGVTFGDGLRCAGGSILRLSTKMNTGGGSQYPTGADLPISQRGNLAPGDTRHYQVWYRNAASFCTASTFNLTNGVTIVWDV